MPVTLWEESGRRIQAVDNEDHPHTIDRWDQATGQSLVDRRH
jgi:hypothetical protein